MGGSGGTFYRRDPSEIQSRVRSEEMKAAATDFEATLNAELAGLLSGYNERDGALVQQRLEGIKEELSDSLDATVDTPFGGSVAKHTYVDGLSDIDTLAVLNDTRLARRDPQSVLRVLERLIRDAAPEGANVTRGSIAITVEYEDGMALQVLPAVRTDEGLRVPAWRQNKWSSIDPEQFRAGLTKRNSECGGKVVPVIKLVKAINATLPEALQLTGYHIESLAISAFRGYRGPQTPSQMIQHYFDRAQELVLEPMTDKTGQSVFVDQHLGPARSVERQQASQLLNRISRRLRNATAAQSIENWRELFFQE